MRTRTPGRTAPRSTRPGKEPPERTNRCRVTARALPVCVATARSPLPCQVSLLPLLPGEPWCLLPCQHLGFGPFFGVPIKKVQMFLAYREVVCLIGLERLRRTQPRHHLFAVELPSVYFPVQDPLRPEIFRVLHL